MLFANVNFGRHLRASRTLLRLRRVQGALATSAIVTPISIALAPDSSPSAWDWIRFALILALATGGVLFFAMAQAAEGDDPDRQQQLIVAGVFVAAAIAINITFTLGSTLLLSIGITIVTLMAGADRAPRSAWPLFSMLFAAIPLWVWSALQAWTWRLLLLIPLAAIAVVVHGHIRAATTSDSVPVSLLSQRAHRLAAWAGMLGSALLIGLIGVLTSASNSAIAIGMFGAIALVALETGTSGAATADSRWSAAIVDAAMIWIAICWIVAL